MRYLWSPVVALLCILVGLCFVAQSCASKNAENADVLLSDDGFVLIYKTEIPWSPIPSTEKQHPSSIALQAALFSVIALVVLIVCFCYICWRFSPRQSSRRHTNVTISNSPSAVVTFQNRADSETATVTLRPGNAQPGAIRSFFSSRRGTSNRTTHSEDVPPNYSTVVAGPLNVQFPMVDKLETPPPAYITVAPFK